MKKFKVDDKVVVLDNRGNGFEVGQVVKVSGYDLISGEVICVGTWGTTGNQIMQWIQEHHLKLFVEGFAGKKKERILAGGDR